MKPGTSEPDTGNRPIDVLGPEARKALKYSRRAYRRAASIRGRIGSTEDRLREWERRVVAKGSTARQWKSLREEGLTLLADSGGVQLEVRQVEQQALKLLRIGLEALFELSDADGNEPARRAYRLLDECEQLRAEELACLGETLAETHSILNLPPTATPDQMLAKLEHRRTVASRLDTRRRDAERLEVLAIGVLTGEATPGDGTVAGEKLSAKRVVKRETSMASRRKKSPAPVDSVPGNGDGIAPDDERPITGPLDDLCEELQRAAARVESIRSEVEGRIAVLIEELEVEHASELEERERRHAEIEEQLAEMRAERKGFEERVLSAENAADDLRREAGELKATMQKERDRLASDRSKMQVRVVQAEQERDEALVLVSSLTRRLRTPGIDEAASEEE